MNPFLEIPIIITNNEDSQKDTTAKLQPDQIEYFYPGFYMGTAIILKSGNIILSRLDYKEFDSALMAYNDFITNKPGQFGTLTVSKKKEENKIITLKPN